MYGHSVTTTTTTTVDGRGRSVATQALLTKHIKQHHLFFHLLSLSSFRTSSHAIKKPSLKHFHHFQFATSAVKTLNVSPSLHLLFLFYFYLVPHPLSMHMCVFLTAFPILLYQYLLPAARAKTPLGLPSHFLEAILFPFINIRSACILFSPIMLSVTLSSYHVW